MSYKHGSGYLQNGFIADFKVLVPVQDELGVFVTGNCKELGNWIPDKAFPLEMDTEGYVSVPYNIPQKGNEWLGKIHITSISEDELQYRYFIGHKQLHERGHRVAVNKLEGHSQTRKYKRAEQIGEEELKDADVFAVMDDEENEVSGSLTDCNSILFILDPAGVEWTSQNYHKRAVRVRLAHAEPVRCTLRKRPEYKVLHYLKGDSPWRFEKQSLHGPLLDSQPIVYRCDMHTLEVCHVRLDFFDCSAQKDSTVPPNYMAYALISGVLLSSSHGRLRVPVRMPLQQKIKYVTDCGTLTIQYAVIKSLPKHDPQWNVLHRSWSLNFNPETPMLHIGHRGCGSSYNVEPEDDPGVCENTLESFALAATAGADLVEFDVMLDVDLTPIVYHDHTVLVKGKENEMVAVKDLYLDLLRNDKVFHLSEVDGQHKFPKTGTGRPFPTLEEALKAIDGSMGFNIEVKYPALLRDGSSELPPLPTTTFREEYKDLRVPFFDKNVYVDGILQVVLTHAYDRDILFSSFDLDICSMLRQKQLKYPVFLVINNSADQYDDIRINYIKRAVYSAKAFELNGVVAPSGMIFRNSWFVPLVQMLGLHVIAYGRANNSIDAINELKASGVVKGVIYDRLPDLISATKEAWRPREKIVECKPGREYCVGYTGFLPGRTSLVGTDSMMKSRAKKYCPPVGGVAVS